MGLEPTALIPTLIPARVYPVSPLRHCAHLFAAFSGLPSWSGYGFPGTMYSGKAETPIFINLKIITQ